jgi:carboxymethylenebutenolidase
VSTYRTDSVAVADGTFDLHVWTPDSGRGPGLLLIQEIFGVGPYIRSVAERLAGLGYVVGAPDLFWRIERNWEASHDQAGLEASLGMMPRFDFAAGIADCLAALARVGELPETSDGPGVIGFCLGGTLAFLVAAEAEPAVCVSYYGSGVPDMVDRIDDISCPTLFHFGSHDAYIPSEKVDALHAALAGRDRFTLNVEIAPHAFDNHEAPMFYAESAAKAAWAKTVAHLTSHLPPHP